MQPALSTVTAAQILLMATLGPDAVRGILNTGTEEVVEPPFFHFLSRNPLFAQLTPEEDSGGRGWDTRSLLPKEFPAGRLEEAGTEALAEAPVEPLVEAS